MRGDKAKTLTAEQAASVLKQLTPYLIVKKRRAEIYLDFAKDMAQHSRHGDLVRRRKWAAEMGALNRRGVPATAG